MKMVKIDDIATEQEGRIELRQLLDFMDEMGGKIALKAVSEKEITAGTRTETIYRNNVPEEVEHPVTAGLQVEYVTQPDFLCPWDFSNNQKADTPEVFPEGMTIIQKYGKQGGAILVKALSALKLNDTIKLQDKFYNYRLRGQRTGYARLYPFELAE